MKLFYLILKAKKAEIIEFESALPIYTLYEERHWCEHFHDHFKDVVFRVDLFAQHASSVDDIQIHAVIVDDDEANNILRNAQLHREFSHDLDSGRIDSRRMCKLARMTYSPKSRKIESAEINKNLHSAYRLYFANKNHYGIKSLVREEFFKFVDLDDQTEPTGPIEKELIEILSQCPLESLFYLEATPSTRISLKAMFKDFIDLGQFRHSTKASLTIVFLALKNPFEPYNYVQDEEFIMWHIQFLIYQQFEKQPHKDFMKPHSNDEWLTEGYNGFYSPIIELMNSSTKVSEDTVRAELSKCYQFKNISKSFAACIGGIVNIGHSPEDAANAERFYERITVAHRELNRQFDMKNNFPDGDPIFSRGTEVFPLPKSREEKSLTNEGPKPN